MARLDSLDEYKANLTAPVDEAKQEMVRDIPIKNNLKATLTTKQIADFMLQADFESFVSKNGEYHRWLDGHYEDDEKATNKIFDRINDIFDLK